MQKLCRKIREKAKSRTGATIVEVSFIVPLLVFLMAGILLFFIFMTDMATLKGASITIAGNETDQEEEDWELVTEDLSFAKLLNHEKNQNINSSLVNAEITASLPWKGLGEYMSAYFEFEANTKAVLDHRKEWKWAKTCIE